MREILFRGKRIDNGEWVYGGYAVTENQVYLIYNQTNSIDLQGFTVDENTIGQYTGLTDKNGKKIFEGDILNTTQFGSVWYNATVEWERGEFLVVPHRTYPREKMPAKIGWITSRLTEVIGNIHDNPELLEGKP